MIVRTHSPVLIEAAIEQSGATPLVFGFDAAEWLADEGNIALADGSNVGLFDHRGPTSCEAHWLLTARGRAALRIGREMLEIMVTRYGKHAIHGQTPLQCKPARLFNRWLGGRSLGVIETVRGPVEFFFISKDMMGLT